MIVDIHAHHVSNELLAAVRKQPGRYGVRLQPIDGGGERLVFDDGRATRPVFATLREMDLRLGQMDESGVEVQCICTWMDLVGYWVPMPAGGRWARLQNDTLAQTAAEQASRLKPVATVPLQDPAAAVTELEYCAKELGMRVVEVGTNINGRNLDDPAFDPFWATAQELDMLVFLHPLDQAGAERMQRYWLFNTVGNLTETTLAATSLIYGAVLDRFPHLRVCLAHAGGFLPYQIGRYDRGYEMHEVCRGCAKPPSAYLKRFFYDTISFSNLALEFLVNVVGADRVVLGTDYPFDFGDPTTPQRVREIRGLTDEQRQAILGETVLQTLGVG
ncbi:MAG TPA: amidohydrolase family protein [Chloroflexota bacterium]|nr:amidohydrolase family protein [Chloroflexota bacterium]